MANQPRYEPLEASGFFADKMASRPPVPGVVARGELRIDNHLYLGTGADGKPATTFPMPVSEELLARGQERYNIFCANCHDRVGQGQGMVVRRGFPRPPSLHHQRLQDAPVGYFYDTVTRGFGRMPSLAPQIPPQDRWAIVAYVRALQLSQHADRGLLTPQDIERLEAEDAGAPSTTGGEHSPSSQTRSGQS